MPPLTTTLSQDSSDFAANRAAMEEKLGKVRKIEDAMRAASTAKRDKFTKRGQILPRERIERLLDPGAPWIELMALAGVGMHGDKGGERTSGSGTITGIGIIAGRRCLVVANDSAIKGGAMSPMAVQKVLRAQEIARQQKLPVVNLVESAGANLLQQAELFVMGGRTFCNQAQFSAMGLPQITVVHGSSTAGGAYLPGLSDYVILVEGKSKMFLAGPPLVKAALGEDATDEELGGSDLHASVTGLGEYVAGDDREAIELARAVLDKIKWDPLSAPLHAPAPLYPEDDLMGVVPVDDKTPFDTNEVIARLVDGSDFLPFKQGYGTETLCGHARIGGHIVGILGNNGPIQPQGSTKAAQFIQLCDQSDTPLIFLQNTTGYMVGKTAEAEGAIKHGSKMIQAVANARVPRMTVVLAGSFGAGNYGMCGRGFGPDFIFSWPTARTAVMGGPQAAKVLEIVSRNKALAAGIEPDEKILAQQAEMLTLQLEKESEATFGSARLWDDGIIDPRDTRRILSECLDIACAGRTRTLSPNSFGVARF